MCFRTVLGKRLQKCILVVILLMCSWICVTESLRPLKDGSVISGFTSEEKDKEEFQEFCELGMMARSHGRKLQRDLRAAECSVTPANEFDIRIDGKMLFTLIMIITWGAAVRAIIHNFALQVPYTIVLMISGLIIGLISKENCIDLNEYTAVARASPKVILFTFLPILIFESAFSIPVHTFIRSCLQIIIVAFPGMVMSTFFTALICMRYFSEYHWSFLQASLFGSIISATDPVAVVAILRELGVSEVLSVMIEGESLLNDGVAILLFEIFEDLLVEEMHPPEVPLGTGGLVLWISKKFLQIAVGGPVFGWVMARVVIFLLSFVFNDPPVEISATIVAAYLTYWLSEDVLGVSGVMAVVLLGVTMSAERTVISPDSEGPVHHFWEILGYLANTVLFVLVGIVITETALTSIEVYDWWNLILLFVSIHVVRFIMLLTFYPILKRIGYGLTWQNLIVMMWGGLRGAVGICLALEVYRSEHFCNDKLMGAKMLFQTAGIVFITLVLNGTTTKGLLDVLKLTEISSGRKEEMNNAVRRIHRVKGRGIRIFQLSSKMFDADWALVNDYCTVKNPYKAPKKADPRKFRVAEAIEAPQPVKDNTTVCWNCHTLVQNEPTSDEYKEMTDDARLRVIKAMKVAYFRMFEVGLISDLAVQILLSDAERAEDQYLNLIHAEHFTKFMHHRGFYLWFRAKLANFEKEDTKAEKPRQKCRHPFWWIVTQEWFEGTMIFIILLNMIPIIYEVVRGEVCGPPWESMFTYLNVLFTLIYSIEFLAKVIGHTVKDYFCDKWNYLDFLVLVVSYMDVIVDFATECNDLNNSKFTFLNVIKSIRLLRASRGLKLLRPLSPSLQKKVSRKINEQLFLGYDVAQGFVHASDEALKFLPQMIENRRVLKKVKECLEKERTQCIRDMASLQQKHPGIAIAVKTRHACRATLNKMKSSLTELKDEGLLDDTEAELLTRFLETKMKRLWHSPPSIEPYSAHILLGNLSWLRDNEELYDIIMSSAELMSYGFGQSLLNIGDEPSGIFIIVAGMVKVTYVPTNEIIELRNKYGKVPNTEVYSDLTFSNKEEDYFSTGFVIGESGCLTGERRAASITAETSLVVYHLSKEVMKNAIETFNDPYDSLESQLWRAVGIRRAAGLIAQLPEYQNATADNIQAHLQRSSVPIGAQYNVLDIPHYVSEVVVIEGYAQNAFTNDTYVAPFLIPPNCSRLLLIENPVTVNRLLIVAHEDLDLVGSNQDIHDDMKDEFMNNTHHSLPGLKKRASVLTSVNRWKSNLKGAADQPIVMSQNNAPRIVPTYVVSGNWNDNLLRILIDILNKFKVVLNAIRITYVFSNLGTPEQQLELASGYLP